MIGGENFEPSWHTLDDVWIYNIGTGSLNKGAQMSAPRSLPSGGTLVNGKIYAIGGHNIPKQIPTRMVEAYDIATNSWSSCASIPTTRVWHATCVLEGKIYVLGGLPIHKDISTISAYTVVERYDPETDTWDTCAPLPTGRWCLSACAVNGKIYAIGGYDKSETLSMVEVYDPDTDQWTTKQAMHSPRGEMGLTVRKGKIFAISGSMWDGSHNTKVYNDVEVYDPESDTWTVSTDLIPQGSIGLEAVTVNDRIYVASGVGMGAHTGVRELYMYDYPIATVETKPYMEARDTLQALIQEDCRLYIVPKGTPADPDSIAKYQVARWDAMDSQKLYLPLENLPNGSYLLYAVGLDNRIGYDVPQFTIVTEVPEVMVQVKDSYTGEILSNCYIYLNDTRFPKDFKTEVILTGWAYDSCSIQIKRSDYFDFDTTVLVKSDTTLVFHLQYVHPEPVFDVYNESLLEKADYLVMKINQHGTIYITPENTPAIADSIIHYAIKSYGATAERTARTSLSKIPSGIYRIYAISQVGRIAADSYVIQLIDKFPECMVEVRDAISKDLIDSCLLIVDGQDSIPGTYGEFTLTGLVYDSCTIEIFHADYMDLDTTLVVLSDTTFTMYLSTLTTDIGTKEQLSSPIKIYPNPTSGSLTIEVGTFKYSLIEITSLNGQLVRKTEMEGGSHMLDLTTLKKGIYFISIRSMDYVTTRKLIKY